MGVLDLLVPPACAACGAYGTALCAACISDFPAPNRSDDRFVAADAGVVLGEHLTVAVAAFAYEGGLRRALGRLKYAHARRAGPQLARAAAPALGKLLRITGDLPLIPVPLHPTRERERGYNQAAVLAEALATQYGLSVLPILARARETARQHRLDRSERLRNLAGAFTTAAGATTPRSAIIVDDILTTSATFESCAMVLRGAGAEEVYGFAIAREV